jgi:hypothetical protein
VNQSGPLTILEKHDQWSAIIRAFWQAFGLLFFILSVEWISVVGRKNESSEMFILSDAGQFLSNFQL